MAADGADGWASAVRGASTEATPADVAPPKKALRSSPDDHFRSIMVLSISRSKSRIFIYRLNAAHPGVSRQQGYACRRALSGQVPEQSCVILRRRRLLLWPK